MAQFIYCPCFGLKKARIDMAKFCGKCGTRLDEATGLCPNCDAEKIRASFVRKKLHENTEQTQDVKKAPSKKEERQRRKAVKKAAKKERWASKTFRQKFKSIILRFIVWVLFLLLLSVAVVGALVYFGFLNIPAVEDIMQYVGLEVETETPDVGRNIPETNTASFSFYPSPEKNITRDAKSGFTYINNQVLITLASQDSRYKLEDYLDTIGGRIVGEIPEMAEYQVLLNEECTYGQIMEYIDAVEQFEWVDSASPNYALKIDTDFIPNDKKWKSEWGDVPDGINWGVEAIDAPGAWEYRREMQRVNIGIIDSMFELNHEDLVFAEMPLGTAEIAAQVSKDPTKWSDHGTHTAGTIAASYNNRKGIAGVSVGCNLYGASLRGLESSEHSSLQAWKVAFYYLVAVNRCKAINVSMGNDQLTFEVSRGEAAATSVLNICAGEIERFLRELIDLNYEFVICKCAGNQNEVNSRDNDKYKYFRKDPDDNNNYPYAYYSYYEYLRYLNGEVENEAFERYRDRKKEIKRRTESGNVDAKYDLMGCMTDPEVKKRIIMVGAVRNLGTHKEGGFLWFGQTTVHNGYEIAAFSQCGERVDVVAPGVDIYSTIKRGYQKKDGTSMAAPHVTGVAALVFSINPDLSGDQVKQIIKDSAVGQYGSDQYGLLNARAAVELARNYQVPKKQEDTQPNVAPIRTTSDERDVVLVLDVSGSMSGTPMDETQKAAVKFVNTILDEDASIGIVSYDETATRLSDFSVDRDMLTSAISCAWTGGGTNIEAGLNEAHEMLNASKARKKIIVLMSDGEPNNGKEGNDLIDYAGKIKDDGILIYTLGFFEKLGSDKASAQQLMEQLASDGCHYEVVNADDLVFFFEDIADQINGQKYIYIRIACPVDVSVTLDRETLNSAENRLNTRTGFGTLTFEKNPNATGASKDDRIKVLRLKEGEDYDVKIVGTGHGIMNYTIGFMDENGDYNDFRRFEDVKITRKTKIDTVASVSTTSVLNIDKDGDGRYDLKLRAGENGVGEEVDDSIITYAIILGDVLLLLLIADFIRRMKRKTKEND